MTAIFLTFIVAINLIVLPETGPVTKCLILSWTLLSITTWFTHRPLLRKGGYVRYHYIERHLIWFMAAAYILALWPMVIFDYYWAIAWIGVIHLYLIIDSLVNHHVVKVEVSKVTTRELLIYSLGAPIYAIKYLMHYKRKLV